MFRNRSTFLRVLAVLTFACAGPPARPAPLDDVPACLTQPDGSRVPCRLSGDEFFNVARDAAGFTLMQDPASGRWVYAGKEDGALVPTAAVAGRDDPARLGLAPGLMPDASVRTNLRLERSAPAAAPAAVAVAAPPKTGRVDNLVVFVRFADDTEFPAGGPAYEALFNGPDGTASMRAYFREVSYGKMDVLSWLVPAVPDATIISYRDSQPRSYYQPYNAVTNPNGYEGEPSGRRQALLINALSWASGRLPDGMRLDADNDGFLDHVTFVIRGGPGAWSSILWPQQGTLDSSGTVIGGVKAGTYDLQIEEMLATGNLGALCHEFFHSLGAPDLYHYTANGIDPVGVWDLMGLPAPTPQHMGAYMKWRYGGWIEGMPQILREGEYALRPLTSPDTNCCRIVPKTSSAYYVLEYRRPSGVFESSLPGGGLLVYRINPAVLLGNMYGPPDEVYIYRPGGTQTANGTLRNAAFSAESGRTRMNDATDPSGFLDGGIPGGLSLEGIGTAGDTISFTLRNQYNVPGLQFLAPPRDWLPQVPFQPRVRVACVDMFGIIAFYSGPMTVSLESGAGANARLLGRTTVTAVDGVAEFSDLAIDRPGRDLRLRVNAPGIPDLVSAPFSTAGPSPTRTERVNVDAMGRQSDGSAYDVAISGDGGRVAFSDSGHNLYAPMVWSGYAHAYLRDFGSVTTRRVSATPDGKTYGDSNFAPTMSADGRYVAFLVTQGYSNDRNLYWRDTWTGATQSIGRAGYYRPYCSISPGGRFVAYESYYAIMLFDAQTGMSERVSLTAGGSQIAGMCESPAMSAEGRYVAFESASGNVAGNWTPAKKQIYVRDVVARTTRCATLMPDGKPANGECVDPSISRDGRYVAFTSAAAYLTPNTPAYTKQIYVRDMVTGEIVCASRGNYPLGFAKSAEAPSISGDGSRVAFRATGKLTSDAVAEYNIYVRDLRLGRTLLANCATDGTAGNGESGECALSDDGHWVAFSSSATNLVPGDTNGNRDVFLRGPLVFLTVANAARALRIAAGLTSPTASDMAALSPVANGTGVGIADAVRLAREAQGW